VRACIGGNAQMRDAFRTLRVPLTLEQVTEFIRKADVLKNNRITYDEFMWAVERADVELTMLIDAGDKLSNEQDVVPPAINAISRHKCVLSPVISSPEFWWEWTSLLCASQPPSAP
jgi:hypothetical protein